MTPLSRRSTNCRDRRFLNYWNAASWITGMQRIAPGLVLNRRRRRGAGRGSCSWISATTPSGPRQLPKAVAEPFFFIRTDCNCLLWRRFCSLTCMKHFFFFAWSMMPNNISARSLNWLIRLNNWDDIYVGFFLCWWHLSWRSWIVVLLHMVAGCNQLQACITSVRVSGVTLIPTKNQASSRTG